MNNKCWHRKVQELKEYRKNYPFGRKSNARYVFKKVFGLRCLNCGQLNKKGKWK